MVCIVTSHIIVTHYRHACPTFRALSIRSRVQEAVKMKVCFNCLRRHPERECTFGNCKLCNQSHNTLLHIDEARNDKRVLANVESNVHDKSQTDKIMNSGNSSNDSVSLSHCAFEGEPQVLLSTAVIQVLDRNGQPHDCRALLDSASQAHFITKKLVDHLKLRTRDIQHSVSGIGHSDMSVHGHTRITIHSKTSSYQSQLSCLVLDKITGPLPQKRISTCKFTIPEGISLADPHYDIPDNIDLLIGVTIFYDLLCTGRIQLGKRQPVLQHTKLGWILGGTVTPCSIPSKIRSSQCLLSTDSKLHDQLERFWTIEEIIFSKNLSEEEQICEEHFVRTHQRQFDGRFIVELPLRCDPSVLGESKDTAVKRLRAMQRKLSKMPKMKEAYTDFLKEYTDLKHMTVVSKGEIQSKIANYLPHHAVIRESNTTTKVRVVFDASCQTSSGKSLNDILLVGPTIQEDLFSIILRFRQHRYVIIADVEKMYRQILVKECQRDLQRILWIDNDEIRSFQLNTVTYGTASASFLSIRCLYQLALENEAFFPEASNIIRRDFYVDDLITGGDNFKQILVLKKQISDILASAGFLLRKWNSNDPRLIHNELVNHPNSAIPFGEETKTLGLIWNTQNDSFQYKNNIINLPTMETKRIILSTVSQIFDPLGLIAPITIRAKILMQHLWNLKIGWDDLVTDEVYNLWLKYHDQLRNINDIFIPRHVLSKNIVTVQLHGFCDASEAAYGACIYTRTTDSNGIFTTHLLCAKSKVAPIKRISLPRLELSGALILSKLCQHVTRAMTTNFDKIYCWSDSTIALAWISGASSQWCTFVANRVAKIQQITSITKWQHVRSQDNPADIISRSIELSKLKECQMWWAGPSWLKQESNKWPAYDKDICHINEELLERRKTTMTFFTNIDNIDFFARYSSLTKLKRVIAYCIRFKNNALRSNSRITGVLQVNELDSAMRILLLIMQSQIFAKEIHDIGLNREVKANSKLRTLHPFCDKYGLIRVGGRLRHAPITYSQKFPIILPSKHLLTRLIIQDEHLRHLHAGPQALLAAIRLKYWPISGRNTVRSVLRKCITCFRLKPIIHEQLMSDLPASRVTPSRPFLNCGVDYAGPFTIKSSRNRTNKAYLCIFVCFVTRAVHLELVSNLSTQAFLNSLKRFIARRGKCNAIYSDNGRNFLGANNELKEMFKLFISKEHQDSVSTFLSEQSIRWHFIPPNSPHMGGLWEAAVRSAKTHLKKIIGCTTLNYEELHTIFTQIEACLNSRPLRPLSEDPMDLDALTPGHFLIGAPLTSIPEEDITNTTTNRLTRYQFVTQMHQHFWKKWSNEYLAHLQQRYKWNKTTQHLIKPGTMVLLRDDIAPPMQWYLGSVTATYPGKDGLIRVVDVQPSRGILQRSLSKLCILPIDD